MSGAPLLLTLLWTLLIYCQAGVESFLKEYYNLKA